MIVDTAASIVMSPGSANPISTDGPTEPKVNCIHMGDPQFGTKPRRFSDDHAEAESMVLSNGSLNKEEHACYDDRRDQALS
jgi:hypothetical protein